MEVICQKILEAGWEKYYNNIKLVLMKERGSFGMKKGENAAGGSVDPAGCPIYEHTR